MKSKMIIAFLKRTVLVTMLLVVGLSTATAQHKKRPHFDPKRFEAELEQFITTNACLTPGESAKFFPVYRQMMKRQRMIFDEMRRLHHIDTRDNETCANAIRRQDELDVEIKLLQQEYHSRFMLILPAGKVMRIIKAEENSIGRCSSVCVLNDAEEISFFMKRLPSYKEKAMPQDLSCKA